MTIIYNDYLLRVTGETEIFYICKLKDGNEETIYIPKKEVKAA